MKLSKLRKARPDTAAVTALALALALGWAIRERSFAQEKAALGSQTINIDKLAMQDFSYQDKKVGQNGVYLAGDTPASSKFVTGRFVLEPGQTPHAPHTHAEEEVMIIETGKGEIVCDGKTTKVGPGSIMFTTPNAPHGIVNTGETPLVFYYVKWASKDSK